MKALGSSEIDFPKKYAVTQYILLFTSLKNTGLSSGNKSAMLLMDMKVMTKQTKKRAPLMFSSPAEVLTSDPE